MKGPEYVLSSGLGDGTDYVLMQADRWRGSDQRISCDYSARPKWGNDVFRALISRDCFDDAASVRVSVKMVDEADGSHPVVDWVPKRHRWSLPVASGLGSLSRAQPRDQPAATSPTAIPQSSRPRPCEPWIRSRRTTAASAMVIAG